MSGALAYKEDDSDYEIINGQVYMMSRPTIEHSQIKSNIYTAFRTYLKGKRCRPFDDGDVFLDENTNVVPDVMIICNPDIIKSRGIFGTPDLIVEIASPSTERYDRFEKFLTYEKYEVKEYWIVHPNSKSVDVYILRNGKLELDNVYTMIPDYEFKNLSEKKKALLKFEIKVSLYDDFYVKLEDIFEYID